jgi:hypothetical protein
MDSAFVDGTGLRWDCRVTWAAIRRSQAAGVDLTKVEEYLGDFYRCSPSLIDAIWSVVEPAAKAAGVTLEAFELRVGGENLEAARAALLAGLQNFFPKGRAVLIAAAVQSVEDQFEQIREQLPKQSTESPESSA